MEIIDIKIVPPNDIGLHELIKALDSELLQLYPAQGIFGVDFTNPQVSKMTFCVAYLKDSIAGCGGLRPLAENAAELKRFYVRPEFRGRGVASGILRFLENQAKVQGFLSIKLETGPKQPEAIGLYRKFGYTEIEAYGEYIGSIYSYCMGRTLDS